MKKDVLIDFSTVEKNLPTYTLKNKGIQAICIDNILGSLGRYADFTEQLLPKRFDKSSRYEHLKELMLKGVDLTPIQVYQILDSYFIIDGHHRVAIAKNEFKAKYIDAEVMEVRFNFKLLKDKSNYIVESDSMKKFLIKLEAFVFKKTTMLNNNILVKPLIVTELKSYSLIEKEILDFKKTYNNGEYARKSMMMASYKWYEERFLPAVKLIEQENILSRFDDRTYTDLYVWIQKHKYFLSQQAGYDVGFDFTAHDFMHKYKEKNFIELIPSIFTDIIKNLVK